MSAVRRSSLDLVGHFGGDDEIAMTAATAFREHAPAMLTALHEALERGDLAALADAAHSLKGAISHFPATEAYVALGELERVAAGDPSGLGPAMDRVDHEIAHFSQQILSFLATRL